MKVNKTALAILLSAIAAFSQTYQVEVSGGTSKYAALEVTNNVTVTSGNLILNAGYVKVKNWTIEAPDYVFDAGYKLLPLSDVEKFVKDNKHLPDVASAKSMKADGIDLTEMNFTLLRKVEELTLYVIEQDKKIGAMEKIINAKAE